MVGVYQVVDFIGEEVEPQRKDHVLVDGRLGGRRRNRQVVALVTPVTIEVQLHPGL